MDCVRLHYTQKPCKPQASFGRRSLPNEHCHLMLQLEDSKEVFGLASHLCNSSILLVVHAKKFCQCQEQLCPNRSISMNPSNEADLGLLRLGLVGLVGDFKGPDLAELHALTQTAKRWEMGVSAQQESCNSSLTSWRNPGVETAAGLQWEAAKAGESQPDLQQH